MSLTLTINGTATVLPTDKPWSLTYAPDAPPQKPTPSPGVTDLAAAIANAKAGETIKLDPNYPYSSKAIRVTTPGLTIVGNGAKVLFDAEGKKDVGLFTLAGVDGFTLLDLDVIGNAKDNAASYVIRSENAKKVHASRVRTFKNSDGSGSGIAVCNGVNGIELVACSTEFTTVYSFYCGGSQTELNNKNITLKECKWGKTNSHCQRTYGVDGMLIEDTTFDNWKSASGRQGIKVMNGKDVVIRRCVFKSTTRFGADVNDPPDYTLKNVLLEDNEFKDWTRVDRGAEVTYRNCTVTADNSGFCFHLFAPTSFDGIKATYTRGKLANSSKNIVSMKGVTFNGQAVQGK